MPGSGDTLKRVKSGDKLDISAGTWNRLIDSVRNLPQIPTDTPQTHDPSYIYVQNASGTIMSEFSTVIVDRPIILPNANLTEFQTRWAMLVDFTDGLADPFESAIHNVCITQEPIRPGRIGRAQIDGVAVCKILQRDPDHKFCVPLAIGAQFMETATRGLPVLWKEGGANGTVQWALVRLGGASIGVEQPPVIIPVELEYEEVGSTQGDALNPAVLLYTIKDLLNPSYPDIGAQDVGASPHYYRRPVATRQVATFGLAWAVPQAAGSNPPYLPRVFYANEQPNFVVKPTSP